MDDPMPDIEHMAVSFTAFFDSLLPETEQGPAMVFTLPMVGPQLQDTGQNLPVALFPGGFLAGLNYAPAPGGGGSGFEDLLEQSLNDRAPYKRVLDESKENGIKYGVVAEDENITCCIAQAPLEPGDQTATLPCGHVFEKDSIMQWLKTERAECPVCRACLESKEVREDPVEQQGAPAPQGGPLLPEPTVHAYVDALINDSLQRAAEREEEMALQAALMESLGLT